MRELAPYLEFYGRDFYGDPNVMVMSAEAQGCYIKYIWLCWQEGGVPSDTKMLAALVGIAHERFDQEIWPSMCRLFEPTEDGRLTHQKVEHLRAAFRAKHEKLSLAAKHANAAKSDKRQREAETADSPSAVSSPGDPMAVGSPVPGECQPSARHSPSSSSSSSSAATTSTSLSKEMLNDSSPDWNSGQGINGFEEFQALYPEAKRNTRVESACRAYVGRISGVPGEHERLMAGLARHLACDQWQRSLANDGGRFIPSMERFVADGLYLDSPPPYVPPRTEREKMIDELCDVAREKERER